MNDEWDQQEEDTERVSKNRSVNQQNRIFSWRSISLSLSIEVLKIPFELNLTNSVQWNTRDLEYGRNRKIQNIPRYKKLWAFIIMSAFLWATFYEGDSYFLWLLVLRVETVFYVFYFSLEQTISSFSHPYSVKVGFEICLWYVQYPGVYCV